MSFPLRSLIHFELLFVKGVRSVSQFISSVDIRFSSTICTLADVMPLRLPPPGATLPECELEKANLSEYFLEHISDWQGFLRE